MYPSLVALLCSTAMFVSGCAAFNPYPEPERRRPDLVVNPDPTLRTKPVSVDEAIGYGRSIEDAYRNTMKTLSAVRTSSNLGIIATAASAIGLAATGGSTAVVTGLALGGASLATAGRQIAVSTYRTIFSKGADSIECAIDQVERHRTVNVPLIDALGARDTLVASLGVLDAAIDDAHKTATENAIDPDIIAFQKQIAGAESERALGRSILPYVDGSLAALDPLGGILLSRVERIRIQVDTEVAKAEPDLLNFDAALRDALKASAGAYTTFIAPKTSQAPPDANLEVMELTTSAALKGTAERLAAAEANAIAARQALRQTLADERTARAIPSDLFAGCALGPGQEKPLLIEPANKTIAAGAAATIPALVSGGDRSYSVATDLLASGVEADFGAATSLGQLLVVRVEATAAKVSSGPHAVVVRDGAGTEKVLVIQVKQ